MPDQAPTPNDAANAQQKANETAKTPESQELPDWAKTELAEARAEAAKYRVEKNQAVDQAKADAAAAYANEKNELSNKLSEAEKRLLKLRVAIGSGIRADKAEKFAELLQGDDETALKSHAETLKELFASPEKSGPDPAVDPLQGSGNHLPLNGDPMLAALKAKVGIS